MYDHIFSQRISELRQLKGVSAREMSLAIGQNENYINKIENKENLPSLSGFFYICEYLDISPKDFFDSNLASPGHLKELIDEAKNFDPDTLKLLVDISKKFNEKF